MGLKETGDVQVSEAIRQVYNFETFPNFVSHKPVIWEQIPVLSSRSMDELQDPAVETVFAVSF